VPAALGPIVYVIALVVIAAGVLWLFESIARRIGGRNTWLLFLGIIPVAFSLMYSIHNWEHLVWWERIVYPLAGPVLAAALLLAAFAAINPADAVILLGGAIRGTWRWLTGSRASTAVTPNKSLERTRGK
jgi:hypothetical protein